MNQSPYLLDQSARQVVLRSVCEVSEHRGWNLLAALVRTNHVHVIVEAGVGPEKVMNDFKSYASRGLNAMGRDGYDRKRWARNGSTRWLWKDQDVREAIHYVIHEQGEPMAVFAGNVP
jgi:REP element-mobilizing transposase RayT